MNQQKLPVTGIVFTFLFLFSFIVAAVPSRAATKEQVEQQRADISKMAVAQSGLMLGLSWRF